MIIGESKSGLRYAIKRSNSSVAYCAITIRCGTRDESNFHNGITHFAEHTIFKGSKDKSARIINNYLDKLGGELNAYTTKEELVIYATVLKEDIKKAESLLLELASSPSFPKKEIEVEKTVVIDEIKSYQDNPSEDIIDRFEELIFGCHPLGKTILGDSKSVAAISSQELIDFARLHFTANNMVFSLVCNIDEKRAEKELIKLIDSFFPQGNEVKAYDRVLSPVVYSPFNKVVKKDNNEALAIIGNFAPSLYDEKGRIATALLCNILGGPASNSMLNKVLREKHGWVYNVEANYTPYSDTGLFSIFFGCDKNNIEQCSKKVYSILNNLKKTKLSDRQLNAAKKQLKGQLAISADNNEYQCLNMGKSLLSLNKIADDKDLFEKIDAIEAENLQIIANTIFTDMSSLTYI